MASVSKNRKRSAWASELDDLIRGACGGFLFGIPLLYTMEVWWIGSYVDPPMMMITIVAAFVVVFLLNRTAGFRKTDCVKVSDALVDTVEALAIGFICATLVLVLLQEISLDVPLDEALGKTMFESVPFSLGVALANQFLSGARDGDGGGTPQKPATQKPAIDVTLADVGATLIGAAIIASNIAPTDEVATLVSAVSAPWLLAIMAASLAFSYGIVFEAGFANQQKRLQHKGIFQRPLSETIVSYLVSLAAAALMLWFFQQLSVDDPWSMWLRYTLILGLPATIGGAAGRLAI